MKRWALALTALVVAAGVFVWIRIPGAPFRFLEGYRSVEYQTGRAYNFQGDFDDLAARAKLELEGLGYDVFLLEQNGRKSLGALRRGKVGHALLIYDRSRWRGPDAPSGNDPGWITVDMDREGFPSFVDRLKAAFGL